MEQEEYDYADYDSSDDNNNMHCMFARVVLHRGVEICYLGVTGDGSDANHDRDKLAAQLYETHSCIACREESVRLLGFILDCGDDTAIAHWTCEQMDRSNPDANAQISIVCHSPKAGATQVLLEKYKCESCM
uniref:Uncharacterized protein n=1 Tax=viral metagenome TaxID=1070528 RepID=A0A6C0KPW6_9ZZZZ